MKSDKRETLRKPNAPKNPPELGKAEAVLKSGIGDSIDSLIEYLVDNNVKGIHPLIMGEVEKRLIIKALERTRGNKLRAAKMLGISRNTFHRKISQFADFFSLSRGGSDS